MDIHMRATYRVQLTPSFDLDDAAAIVGYLARLGVSHLYTSPLAEATPGSTHGYDVTDPQQVRAELGGEAALRRLWQALDDHGMGMVVDIVPNHMGIRHPGNRWWQDVLREGRGSAYADHFDIDWHPHDPASQDKVVLPFLGRPLDEAVRHGDIRVERGTDPLDLVVVHHGDRWPASAESLAHLDLGPGDCVERVDGALEGLHRSPEAMERFLEAQHWRAVHWREAPSLLNWRRFFDVTDLAAVQVERAEVFDDVHLMLRRWFQGDDELAARVVQGVRVDHVDGLVDPEGYLVRLRELVGPDRLVVVEKILAAHEELRSTWPVDGTTGYEVVARIDEALTEPEGAAELRRLAARATGEDEDWDELVRRCRHLVAERLLAPEGGRVAAALVAALTAAEVDEATADPDAVAAVVGELAIELAVYRTYLRPGGAELTDVDRHELDRAVARVRVRRPDLDGPLLSATHELLAGGGGPGPTTDALAARFAQLTAPLAAKAVEDTAFYREPALPWLGEVGGEPSRSATSLAEVGADLARLSTTGSGTFTGLTTHDTKRSGDVRARLSRLAADPRAFATAAESWSAAIPRSTADRPSPRFEWQLWTAVVGAWPIDRERLHGYATKAMREAKDRTSWTDPDEHYEAAVHGFVDEALTDEELTASIDAFVATLRGPGRAAALAQTAVAATAVGSPDLYQGDEVWNLSLVDPDNRRPVDHLHLAELLHQVEDGIDLARLWRDHGDDPDDEGLVKLGLWHRLLTLRARRADSFEEPSRPLAVEGPAAAVVLAYRRGDDVAVVAPLRHLAGSFPDGSVTLPAGRWRDVATGVEHDGGEVAVVDLLDGFCVAVLERS